MKTNKEMCKSYYEKNKEKIKSKRRKDYTLDKEKILERNMIYQKLNTKKISEHKRKCYIKNKIKYIKSAMIRKKKQIDINTIFIDSVLLESKCLDCECNIKSCLDFHHIHNKKNTITILKFSGYPIQTIKKEIDNCIILCSNCHRKRHAKNLNHPNKKVKFVRETKMTSCCSKCGYSDCAQALDFHHTKDKIDNINSMTHKKQYTLQDIVAEIKKCVILCSNCHRQYHSESSSSEENPESGSPVNKSSRFSNL